MKKVPSRDMLTYPKQLKKRVLNIRKMNLIASS